MRLKNQNVDENGNLMLKIEASKDDAVIEGMAQKKIGEVIKPNPPIEKKAKKEPKEIKVAKTQKAKKGAK